jgi:hypothetical protein
MTYSEDSYVTLPKRRGLRVFGVSIVQDMFTSEDHAIIKCAQGSQSVNEKGICLEYLAEMRREELRCGKVLLILLLR